MQENQSRLHLAKTGHEVTVIEMQKRVAHEACGLYRMSLLEELKRAGVVLYDKTVCTENCPKGVIIKKEDGSEEFLEADTIVHALGMESNDTSLLEHAVSDIAVYKIGDCSSVGKIGTAIKSGFDVAMSIL